MSFLVVVFSFTSDKPSKLEEIISLNFRASTVKCGTVCIIKPIPLFEPESRTDKFIARFTEHDSVFRAYNIHPVTIISQALIEQGARHMKGYRHFNISYTGIDSTSYHSGYDVVWDNGRKRKYRTYTNLSNAIKDYCSLISKLERYKKALVKMDYKYQISIIARGGYAENPDYEKLVLAKAETVNKIYNKVKQTHSKK